MSKLSLVQIIFMHSVFIIGYGVFMYFFIGPMIVKKVEDKKERIKLALMGAITFDVLMTIFIEVFKDSVIK